MNKHQKDQRLNYGNDSSTSIVDSSSSGVAVGKYVRKDSAYSLSPTTSKTVKTAIQSALDKLKRNEPFTFKISGEHELVDYLKMPDSPPSTSVDTTKLKSKVRGSQNKTFDKKAYRAGIVKLANSDSTIASLMNTTVAEVKAFKAAAKLVLKE